VISLFDKWKNRSSHKEKLFITDGIIDTELWKKSSDQTMFLLKEAYDSKRVEGSWDLPSLIRKRGVSGRTFKPMAQWAWGIHKVLQDGVISPYIQNSKDVKHALLSSAIVNIKKSGGKKSSGSKNLRKYVDEDWDLLSEQVKEISPKIIVCGNTWSLISEKLTYEKISDRCYICDEIIYVDFWHPSNRASNLMNYYALCAIIQIAKKKLNVEL